MPDIKNKIKVIIPFYNPGDAFDRCINSVLAQDYENYEILFVDNASTDGSYDKIPACTYKTKEDSSPEKDENDQIIIIAKHPLLEKTTCSNIVAWRANTMAKLEDNIYNAVKNFCAIEDIVVIVEGTDFIMKNSTLSTINDLYNDNHDVSMFCGTKPYYDKFINEIVEILETKKSGVLSFRASLYHKKIINKEA